jgi:hypothetical protein
MSMSSHILEEILSGHSKKTKGNYNKDTMICKPAISFLTLFFITCVHATGPIGPGIIQKISMSINSSSPEFLLSGISLSVEAKGMTLAKAIRQKHSVVRKARNVVAEYNYQDKAIIKNRHAYSHYGFVKEKLVPISTTKKWKKILVQINEKLSVKEKSIAKNTSVPFLGSSSKRVTVENFRNDDGLDQILAQVVSSKKKNSGDDLVFYNYNKKNDNHVIDSIQHVASAPIPQAVKDVINREMGSSIKKARQDSASTIVQAASFFSEKPNKTTNDSYAIRLTATEYNLGLGLKNDEIGFQFKSPYNENPIVDLDGSIDIEAKSGVLRGTILRHGAVATKIELPISSQQKTHNIPLLTYDSVRNFLDKYEIDGRGGMYLADVSDNIEDVDIESVGDGAAYERRVFLSENLKEVKIGKSFRYILFIGVVSGNATIKVLGHHGKMGEKITLITPDEILYDYLDIDSRNTINLELRMKNTMGSVTSLLNLDKENISDFITGTHPKKVSAGKYQVFRNASIQGMKKYLELNYLTDKIYIGVDKSRKLEVPSNEFVLEVLNQFDVVDSGLLDRCLVQINIDEEPVSIEYALDSSNGGELLEVLYLDNDGTFSDGISPMTRKAFFMGHMQGVVSLRVKTKNNAQKYLRSYCSSSTYLLEHL